MDLERFDKIYDDVDSILDNNPRYVNGLYFSDPVDDSKLMGLKEYAEKFIDETDRGILRTILTCLKPFSKNEIIRGVYIKLSEKLNQKSYENN
jgi:hypothetical protein